MINFKITGLDNNFLTIEKSAGKSIPLKLGELVKAEVMDLLPTGGVTLKIKGNFITAQTTVPLEKGAEAFFKVTSLPLDGKELKLQFMGYMDEAIKGEEPQLPSFNLKESALPKLIHDLTNNLSELKRFIALGEKADTHTAKLQDLNSQILKALPLDINSLPKEMRMQLQTLLQTSLKITGESIQTRLDNFINRLPEGIKSHPIVENIRKELMVSIEKLLQTPIKSVLQDTGVALEAKLKAIAALLQQMEQPEEYSAEAQKTGRTEAKTSEPPSFRASEFSASIKKDLKAGLLQMKELLTGEGKEAVKNVLTQDLTPAQREGAVRVIDGLLKDIETFQVLSKTTDSFYTFLPVSWRELKDGEISFKRGRSDSKGMSYSCKVSLDLERFGKLDIMLMMYNREFFVSFRAENAAFQAVLNNNANELDDSFKTRGMNLKAVNFLDKNDTSLDQFENMGNSEKAISIKA
ncbi:MAG: flagellar hook-length control protein FliK [Nitrospirae bacterium]|nr:flagellar hook-length control protein FliK [Nitrospirota bacterium]MCL5978890.1 flagellar hook-length control protein FliK [Nitrospirota bacterium]